MNKNKRTAILLLLLNLGGTIIAMFSAIQLGKQSVLANIMLLVGAIIITPIAAYRLFSK